MSLQEDVFSALTAGSPAVLRAYNRVMPQNVVLPAVTFQVIAGTHDFDIEGPTGLTRKLVRVDSWATIESSAYALIVEATSLMVASVDFQVTAINETGADTYEEDTKLYRESREFTVWATT